MPLIKSKGQKAFSKNVETEMNAGKPQNQALAIAYDVKRRNSKKKMAKGGMVENPSLQQSKMMPPQDVMEMHPEAKAARGMEGVDYNDQMEMDMRKSRMEMHSEDKAAMGRAYPDQDNMKYQDKPMMDMHREYKQKMSHADDADMEFQKKPSMENHGLHKAAQGMARADEDNMDYQKKPPMPHSYEAQAGKDNDYDSEQGEDMVDRIMRKKMAKGGMAEAADSVDLPYEESEHPNQYYPINENEVVGKEWASNSKDYSDSGMDGMDEDYHSPRDMDMDGDDDLQRDVVDHIDRIMSKMNRKRR